MYESGIEDGGIAEQPFFLIAGRLELLIHILKY